MDKIINGYKFVQTSSVCPEQYDVYKDYKRVAYIRLRWGDLTVSTSPWGAEIYSHSFNDYQGSFETEKERTYYLRIIAKEIKKFYQKYGNDYVDDEEEIKQKIEAKMAFMKCCFGDLKWRRLGKKENKEDNK